jgi:hypothetical protein
MIVLLSTDVCRRYRTTVADFGTLLGLGITVSPDDHAILFTQSDVAKTDLEDLIFGRPCCNAHPCFVVWSVFDLLRVSARRC